MCFNLFIGCLVTLCCFLKCNSLLKKYIIMDQKCFLNSMWVLLVLKWVNFNIPVWECLLMCHNFRYQNRVIYICILSSLVLSLYKHEIHVSSENWNSLNSGYWSYFGSKLGCVKHNCTLLNRSGLCLIIACQT